MMWQIVFLMENALQLHLLLNDTRSFFNLRQLILSLKKWDGKKSFSHQKNINYGYKKLTLIDLLLKYHLRCTSNYYYPHYPYGNLLIKSYCTPTATIATLMTRFCVHLIVFGGRIAVHLALTIILIKHVVLVLNPC